MVNLKLIVSISAVFSEHFTLKRMMMMMQLQWIILSFPVGLSLNREGKLKAIIVLGVH